MIIHLKCLRKYSNMDKKDNLLSVVKGIRLSKTEETAVMRPWEVLQNQIIWFYQLV